MFIIVTNAKGISGYICFIKKSWYVCLTNISDNFNNKGSIVPKSNCASVTIFHLLRKGSTFKKWKHHFMFSIETNEHLKIGSILSTENHLNFLLRGAPLLPLFSISQIHCFFIKKTSHFPVCWPVDVHSFNGCSLPVGFHS